MTSTPSAGWPAITTSSLSISTPTGWIPPAGEILPASLARHHHVVAIKRKFGTPVVATSDPDDLNAHDMIRASLGRDFISVVASRDQIGSQLDKLFGPDNGDLGFEHLSVDPQFTDTIGAVDSLDTGTTRTDGDGGDPQLNGTGFDLETIGITDYQGREFRDLDQYTMPPPVCLGCARHAPADQCLGRQRGGAGGGAA